MNDPKSKEDDVISDLLLYLARAEKIVKVGIIAYD